MKRQIILLISLCIATSLFAQPKKASNADALVSKPGVVIQREYLNIGKVKNISLLVAYLTDMSNNQKISACDIECVSMGSSGASDAVLLDPDEVDGLIAFFQNIQENISKAAAPKNYSEYSYMSKSGLQAGCYWDNGWKTYVKVNSDDSKTDVEFSSDDLALFLSSLKLAKSKM